jgi:hypothetical protein
LAARSKISDGILAPFDESGGLGLNRAPCDLVATRHRRRDGIVMSDRACGPLGGSLAKAMKKISYDGYRFSPEIIQQAIWLYLRFTLSFRDVEDLLAERGIAVV